MGAPPPPPHQRWVPNDVKLLWLGFLDAGDLARSSAVCKSWAGLVEKSVDARFAATVGVKAPPLGRAAKLQLVHRIQCAHAPENMGYLLSWAAGCRGEPHSCDASTNRRPDN